MHTKIWWSYVHIRYLVHVQKWTYSALGWPYGWALNFNKKKIKKIVILIFFFNWKPYVLQQNVITYHGNDR